MKKYVFAYVETKRTVRRTYGGSNYTLTVYDLTGGKVERIGTVDACTAGHKGESSEAWGVVLQKRPIILAVLANRAKKQGNAYLLRQVTENKGYHMWQYKELGVELHAL